MQYLFSYLAGVLSNLSPCVLPLIPILLGSALAAHRFGPIALTGGLTLSNAVFGMLFAVAGQSLGIDRDAIRIGSAVLMGGFGIILLVPAAQLWLARITAPVAAGGHSTLARLPTNGLLGQFAVGAMMGAIWTPCTGPTLGAAVAMASQAETRFAAAAMMMMFAIGASTPLLVLSYGSRQAVLRRRNALANIGGKAKVAMGVILIVFAATVLTGADKQFETLLTNMTPDWLLDLMTAF
jgi:cytochrome c-type biogenesis protein